MTIPNNFNFLLKGSLPISPNPSNPFELSLLPSNPATLPNQREDLKQQKVVTCKLFTDMIGDAKTKRPLDQTELRKNFATMITDARARGLLAQKSLKKSSPPSNPTLSDPIPINQISINRIKKAEQQKEIARKVFTSMVISDRAPALIAQKFLDKSATAEVRQFRSIALHSYFTDQLTKQCLEGKLSKDDLIHFISSPAQYDLNNPEIIKTVGSEEFSNFIEQHFLTACLKAFPEIDNKLTYDAKRDFVIILEALRALCLEEAQTFIQKRKEQGLLENVSGDFLRSVYEPAIEGNQRRPIEDPCKLLPEAPNQLPINSITAVKYTTAKRDPYTGDVLPIINPFSGKKITGIQDSYHLMLVFYRLEMMVYTDLIARIHNEEKLKELLVGILAFKDINLKTSFNVLTELLLALKEEAEAKGRGIATQCEMAYINGDFLPHIVKQEFTKRVKWLKNNNIQEKEKLLLEIYKEFAQKMEKTYEGCLLDQENLPTWNRFQNLTQENEIFQRLKKEHIALIKA